MDSFKDEIECSIIKDIEELISFPSKLKGLSDFYKEADSKIWWIEELEARGQYLYSFDMKKIYNLFVDYPHNMTEEEVRIFDRENPYWTDYFTHRK